MFMPVRIDQDHKRWTAADLREIPDDRNRYEIIDGELLVTPSPAPMHQWLAKRLFLTIHAYVQAHGFGEIVFAPADVQFADDTVVEPDLFVIPPLARGVPRTWNEAGKPLLIIEILSPISARTDRVTKRRRYQHEGIQEYWIVDNEARVIERWRPADERPETATETLAWKPDERIAPLVIDLAELFATI